VISAKRTVSSEKLSLGWLERVSFPNWHISGIKAKIDTGARTSSLDVDHITRLDKKKVRFNVVLSKTPKLKKITITARVSRIAKVKSSPIHHEERIFVMADINLGPVRKEIEVNLIDRSNMVYRMLLGRSAIKGEFLVDVSRKYLLSKKKKLNKTKKVNK